MALSKKRLVEILTDREVYEEEDDILIDELFYNIKLIKECKDDIKTNGKLEKINAGKTLVINPSFTMYEKCLGIVIKLSVKLGLSPKDRSELKIGDSEDGVNL